LFTFFQYFSFLVVISFSFLSFIVGFSHLSLFLFIFLLYFFYIYFFFLLFSLFIGSRRPPTAYATRPQTPAAVTIADQPVPRTNGPTFGDGWHMPLGDGATRDRRLVRATPMGMGVVRRRRRRHSGFVLLAESSSRVVSGVYLGAEPPDPTVRILAVGGGLLLASAASRGWFWVAQVVTILPAAAWWLGR